MKMHPVIRERVIPAVAATGVIAMLGAAGWHGYGAVMNRPIREIAFTGDVAPLSKEILDEFALELKKRTVGTSLASVRENAKRIPWVRDAAVRRQWPDGIEVRFETYRAFARWNDNQLLSPLGEVFTAEDAAKLARAELELIGNGVHAGVLAEAAFLEPLHDEVGNPLRVVLGREDMVARAQRFAAAWPQLAARGIDPKYADLRYPNGFALRQPETLTPALSQGRGRTRK